MGEVIPFPEAPQLSQCCNAYIIWDECDIHYDTDIKCEANTCEECGTQLETDCGISEDTTT